MIIIGICNIVQCKRQKNVQLIDFQLFIVISVAAFEKAADGMDSDGNEVQPQTRVGGAVRACAGQQVTSEMHSRRCVLLRVRELDSQQRVP